MESAEIARRFLGYFEQHGHTVVPSASLIADDPTLLLVNAGMQPFKPYFLGQQTPPFQRATARRSASARRTSRRSARPPGTRTFFQMLGNFSFGDYFKEKAIPFAWELLTRPETRRRVRLPRGPAVGHRATSTTMRPRSIWRDAVGVPESRIQRRGMEDNYWSHGRARAGRPLLGDLLRPRPRVRARGRPGGGRGPLPGGLEPRLHAVPARRGRAARTTSTSRASCRRGTSTPAWAWSGWPPSCRAWTTSTRSTPCGRCSTGRRS